MNPFQKIARKLLTEVSYAHGTYLVPPEFVSLILTLRCNFRCASCSIWQLPQEKSPLTQEEWLAVADDVSQSLPANTFIELNGGEALLEHALVIAVTRRLKQHFKRVILNSNGSLFTRERIQELENAGIDTIKLSLYSTDKNTHDTLRGHAGAFESAQTAIRLIKKSRINLEVGILVTSKNIRHIPELTQSLTRKKIVAILQPLDESIEGAISKDATKNEIISELWPNKKDTIQFFRWAKNNAHFFKNHPNTIETMKQYYLNPKSSLQYRCFSGQRTLIVYPNGNTTLCFKRGVVGNINKSSLKTILKSHSAHKERRGITRCRKYCRIVGCNFSRGFKEIARDMFRK